MSTREYGPSWGDAGEVCRRLVRRGYYCPEVKLVPNWRLDDAKGNVVWTLTACLRRRGKVEGGPYHAQASFGKGGAFPTAPAALLHVVERLEALSAEAEAQAVSQAAF